MAPGKPQLRLVSSRPHASQEIEDEANLAQRHRFGRSAQDPRSESSRLATIAVMVGAAVILVATLLAMVGGA